MPNREEALGQTKDMLKRLCLLAGLGTPCGGPGRAGGKLAGERAVPVSQLRTLSSPHTRRNNFIFVIPLSSENQLFCTNL